MQSRANKDRSHWKLEVMSFQEAEAQTRDYWRAASPAERLNALESLREQLYGEDKASRRLQRVLSLVHQTQG